MRRAVLGILFLGVIAASVGLVAARRDGDDDDGAGPAGTAEVAAPASVPAGQDLYRPPDSLIEGPAGSLVWYQATSSPVAGASSWRILYRSRSADDEPILTSGALFRPAGPPPAGGFPVISWATGSPGLADACAPSRSASFIPALARALAAGFMVVAADGEGLGTRGPAQYLIGQSEAHTLLDAARAAGDVPGTHAGTRVGLWGYSSGGHGALFAAQEAAAYAPELDLLGTAAVSPVVDVGRFVDRPGTYPGFTFLTLGGWARVYSLDPATIFTERARARLPRLSNECPATYLFDWDLWRAEDVVVADPQATTPWDALLRAERADGSSVTGPLLVMQGSADPIVSGPATIALVRRMCGFGDTVKYVPLPGEGHDIAYSTAGRVIDWLASRATGVAAISTC